MTANDVLSVLTAMDAHGIRIWLDGGYPAESLMGRGTVKGRVVSCISPEWLVRFHTGYDVDATDWADVSALCERFGIIVPSDYARFR